MTTARGELSPEQIAILERILEGLIEGSAPSLNHLVAEMGSSLTSNDLFHFLQDRLPGLERERRRPVMRALLALEQEFLRREGFFAEGATPRENFTRLLSTPGYRISKTDLLVHVQNSQDPWYVEAIRPMVEAEADPLILASMLNLIGARGTVQDADLLRRCMDHADPRVVASALESWRQLGIREPLPLEPHLASTHPRVRSAAETIREQSPPPERSAARTTGRFTALLDDAPDRAPNSGVFGHEDRSGTLQKSLRKTRKIVNEMAENRLRRKRRAWLAIAGIGTLIPAGIVWSEWRTVEWTRRPREAPEPVLARTETTRPSRRLPVSPAVASIPESPISTEVGSTVEVEAAVHSISPSRLVLGAQQLMFLCPDPPALDTMVGMQVLLTGKVASQPGPGWVVLTPWSLERPRASHFVTPVTSMTADGLETFRFGGGGALVEDPSAGRAGLIELAVGGAPSDDRWVTDSGSVTASAGSR